MEDRAAAIHANMEHIYQQVERSARASGRELADIKLVVVTKAQPLEVAQAAAAAGVKILGENYPEEALQKILAFEDNHSIEWHMIGHLQSRKAKIVAEYFDYLHSLDSVKLAEKLERLLEGLNRKLPVLLEINVGEEESKYGWPGASREDWEELLPEVDRIRQLPHLQIAGLMTMPPLFDDPEDSRPYFQRMRSLQAYLQAQFPEQNFTELSMGTSADFEAAIQEGATFVRIGQAILGPRLRPK